MQEELKNFRADQDRPIAHWRASDQCPQYLHEHLSNVAKITSGFSKKIRLEIAGELIGLVHDLGKYSDEFKAYIYSALGLKNPDADDYVDADSIRGKVDHSTAGAQLIWRELGGIGPMERQMAKSSLFNQMTATVMESLV